MISITFKLHFHNLRIRYIAKLSIDLDEDGDIDVLSASRYDDKIAWYENLGGGNFSNQNILSYCSFAVLWQCISIEVDYK